MSPFRIEDQIDSRSETSAETGSRTAARVREAAVFTVVVCLTAVAVSGVIWALAAIGRTLLRP